MSSRMNLNQISVIGKNLLQTLIQLWLNDQLPFNYLELRKTNVCSHIGQLNQPDESWITFKWISIIDSYTYTLFYGPWAIFILVWFFILLIHIDQLKVHQFHKIIMKRNRYIILFKCINWIKMWNSPIFVFDFLFVSKTG